jgi:hypothetical protein
MARSAFPDINQWTFSDNNLLELFGSGADTYGIRLKNIGLSVDDFASENLNKWQVWPCASAGGTVRPNIYSVVGRQLQINDTVIQTGAAPGLVSLDYYNNTDSVWTLEFDYTPIIKGDAHSVQTNGVLGNGCALNGYNINFNSRLNQIALTRKGNGVTTAFLGATATVVMNVNTSYHMKLQKTATHILLFCNGTQLVNVAETLYPYLNRIVIPLTGTTGNATQKFCFDNFAIQTANTFSAASPTAESGWIPLTATAINGAKFFENSLGGAGNIRYQYALNGGSFNGAWLTHAQMATALAAVEVLNTYQTVKFKIQFNSNGSQQVEVMPSYISISDANITTKTVFITAPGVGNLPAGDYDSPMVIYADKSYERSWNVVASSSANGYDVQDTVTGREDLTWKSLDTAGTKYLTYTRADDTPYLSDSFAIQGANLTGLTLEVQASDDGFTSEVISLWGPTVITDTGNNITKYGTHTPTSKKARRLVLSGIPSSATEIAYVLFSNKVTLPYVETFDPDAAQVTGIVNTSDSNLFNGSFVQKVTRQIDFQFPELYDNEYAVIYTWVFDVVLQLKPFFYVPSQAHDNVSFCIPKKDAKHSAPVSAGTSGMRKVPKFSFDARMPY